MAVDAPPAERQRRTGTVFSVVNSGGSGAALEARLRKGDVVKAESDALVTMSAHVKLGSRMDGGWIRSILRSGLSNESVFFQTLKAKRDDQDILLAPQDPGDIVILDVGQGHEFKLINGAFLAAEDAVELQTETQWDFGKMAFGAGLFILRAKGTGALAINSTGSMVRYELAAGERRSVDNGHLVAWSADMRYEVNMATDSIFTSLTSGEGMMCHFEGPGELYIQTHKPSDAGMNISKDKHVKGGVRFFACLFVAFIMIIIMIIVIGLAVSGAFGVDWDHHQYERGRHGGHRVRYTGESGW